jgi:hypothetical protein
VLADPSVPDADVDAFVAAFQASFVPEEAEGEAEAPTRTVEVGGRRLRYLERAPRRPPATRCCRAGPSRPGGLAHPGRAHRPRRDINPDYIDGFVAAERRRELKGVLELLFADQGLVSRKLVDDVLRYRRLDGVEEALRRVAGVMYPSGRQTVVLTGELDRLQAPALVVWLPGPHPARRPGRGAGGQGQGRGPARGRPLAPPGGRQRGQPPGRRPPRRAGEGA